jgi:hypothetical protein
MRKRWYRHACSPIQYYQQMDKAYGDINMACYL